MLPECSRLCTCTCMSTRDYFFLPVCLRRVIALIAVVTFSTVGALGLDLRMRCSSLKLSVPSPPLSHCEKSSSIAFFGTSKPSSGIARWNCNHGGGFE